MSEDTPARFRAEGRIRALVTLGLLLAPLTAAARQQTCLAATPAARAAITSYLQDPDESAWLQAHGITATSADQLTPLTDATDRAMCRKMDSTMKTFPISYLRMFQWSNRAAVTGCLLQRADAELTVRVRVRPSWYPG